MDELSNQTDGFPPSGEASTDISSAEEIEAAIGELWKSVFRQQEINRDDNFFELGGNSVLAMQLAEEFGSVLGVQIQVVLIFQNPTIREQAKLVIPAL